MGWRNARFGAFAVALILSAPPAFAHDVFGTMGPFWGGALHVVDAALAVATLIGFGAALVSLDKPFVFPALVITAVLAGVATAAGVTLSDFGAAGAIVVGLAAALIGKLRVAFGFALAVVAGLGAGVSAEVDAPSVVAAIGAAFAAFLFGGLSYSVFARIDPALPMARRIAGAWVAAIGLLIAALTLFRLS